MEHFDDDDNGLSDALAYVATEVILSAGGLPRRPWFYLVLALVLACLLSTCAASRPPRTIEDARHRAMRLQNKQYQPVKYR